MKSLEFVLETITPMFMAGADGKTFELRPPSVKGAMRFWWRAFYWGRNSGNLKPEDIEEKEGKIFGTTSGDGQKDIEGKLKKNSKAYKSRFSIRLKQQNLQPTLEKFPNHPIQVVSRGRKFSINILDYLAYGTYDYQRGKGNVFNRQYLPAGQEFDVYLNIFDDAVAEEVIKSFYFLSVFGGLGAKSRNGFGNFMIKKIAIEDPELLNDIKDQFPFPKTDFLRQKTKNGEVPNFTAFSGNMKIFKLKNMYDTWDDCLAELGKIYRESRGNLEQKHEYEKRQYIGAPIIVGKRDKSLLTRRAKPYFMRVIKKGDYFDGYILYLPSKYCDGLEHDRNGNPLPQNVDEKFQEACDQFNSYLCLNNKIEEIRI